MTLKRRVLSPASLRVLLLSSAFFGITAGPAAQAGVRRTGLERPAEATQRAAAPASPQSRPALRRIR